MAEIFMAAAAVANAAAERRQMLYLKGSATERLEVKIQEALTCIQTREIDKPDVYDAICTTLGSSIDTATAIHAVPSSSHIPQLFFIVKEVRRCMTKLLQPSLMLLMLQIKAACEAGWFPDGEKSALLTVAKEVSYGFCNFDKMSIEPINAHSCVSTIISRFYPTMTVENILTSFGVKEAGYGNFVADFHISRGHLPHHCQNLRLLVARMDNMETAACIASPLNVNFLINGSAVPKRTKSDMVNGPQLPSNVSKMIKYGVNLLQVCGDFDGQYIIAVASMNLLSSPDPPQLQDYVHNMSDRECEVSDMSSQISLCCPISQCRIKVPVKGQLCKHRQCFDYKNFMEINSVTPTWRCPHCEKPVCHLDIRIDQDFLKILNEVADDASDIIISANGTRMVAMTEKSQSTETNRNITNQNNQVSDAAGNRISIEANDALPKSSLSLPGLTTIVSTEHSSQHSSILPQSTVTSREVSPPPGFGDSRLQSQGLCGTVLMPPPMQQIRHLVNPVNSTTAPGQHQAEVGATEQAHHTTLIRSSATRSPPSIVYNFEQLMRRDERQHNASVQSHSAPAVQTLTSNMSPTQLPELSGNSMPSGSMRGRLTGKERAAAQLESLGPVRQPIRGNQRWSLASLSQQQQQPCLKFR